MDLYQEANGVNIAHNPNRILSHSVALYDPRTNYLRSRDAEHYNVEVVVPPNNSDIKHHESDNGIDETKTLSLTRRSDIAHEWVS